MMKPRCAIGLGRWESVDSRRPFMTGSSRYPTTRGNQANGRDRGVSGTGAEESAARNRSDRSRCGEETVSQRQPRRDAVLRRQLPFRLAFVAAREAAVALIGLPFRMQVTVTVSTFMVT